MLLLLCLFCVIIALLVTSAYFNGSTSPKELFECNYAHKVPPTPRGCFRYTAKADDTCTGIQNIFKTTANNVVSTVTGDYCVDSSASSTDTPTLQAGQTFRICPQPNCIYKKLSYDTTCGNLAMKYNTKTNNIYFRERSSNAPMQPCVDTNQSIPTNARIQLCQNDDQDTAQLLDTYDPTTYEECKALCHNYGGGGGSDGGSSGGSNGGGSGGSNGGSDSGGSSGSGSSDNPKCTHMLYGNGTCRLFKKATPLMNIVSSHRDSNAFRCSPLPALQYAGALPKEVGNYTCDGNNTCAWLGGQGCEQGCSDSTSCIPPYKRTFPSPSSRCAWQSIAQQHPEMMRAQKEFVNGDGEGDMGRFLSGVCGG